jgi:parvulin-like peptidyl-prolyl isomerase
MKAGLWFLISLAAGQTEGTRSVSATLPGQAPPPVAADSLGEGVAAVVDGEPIHVDEVERELAIAFPRRPITPAAKEALWHRTVEQLVSRRLVQRWLAETKQAASPADVDLAWQQLRTRLAQRGATLEEFLREQRLDEAGLRRSLAWQIGWGRFLDRQLTEANIQKYFDKHRRDFDGTQLRVAHILIKAEAGDGAQSLEAARAKAERLLKQIRDGSLPFAEAARLHSDSPSGQAGGEIGWIGRREPMPESFARAAFSLPLMQLSEPVESSFGVHLIQCLEEKAGENRWQDVRADLEQAITQYLFEWSAGQVRARARVEYARPKASFEPTR